MFSVRSFVCPRGCCCAQRFVRSLVFVIVDVYVEGRTGASPDNACCNNGFDVVAPLPPHDRSLMLRAPCCCTIPSVPSVLVGAVGVGVRPLM